MARPPSRRRPAAGKHAQSMRKPVSRRPAWVGPVATVVGVGLLVAAFVAYRWWTTPPPPNIGTTDAAQVLATLTGLQPAELDQIGLGSATNSIKNVSGPALSGADGKPEVFYLGAEYCPYCAAERWAMIIGLSRFGTFSGLETTTSSSTDVYANTPTFTFRKATYTSQYLDFQAVETLDRNQNPLRSPTAEQTALLRSYGTGSIPFIDFGNRYSLTGATYLPDILAGLTWQQVAVALQSPGTPQAKAILGSANLITAATCELTGQQPAEVCSSSSIRAIETRLGTGH
jgi:Domain of unknown function (DUF929)